MSRKHFSRYIFIVILYCTNVNAIWLYEKKYANPILERLYADINRRYIDLSPAEVAKRAEQQETAPAYCFEQEFLIPPFENERISDERKNKEIMQLVRDAYRQQDPSEFKVAITEFKADIAIALDNKEKALTDELNGYSIPKILAVGGLVAGLGVLGGSALSGKRKLQKRGGGTGFVVAGVSGAYLYSIMGQSELIKTNIAQIQLMKKSWENFS